MTKLISLFKAFSTDEDGAAMIEYSILIGLIAAVVIAAIVLVGTWVDAAWTVLVAALGTAPAVPVVVVP